MRTVLAICMAVFVVCFCAPVLAVMIHEKRRRRAAMRVRQQWFAPGGMIPSGGTIPINMSFNFKGISPVAGMTTAQIISSMRAMSWSATCGCYACRHHLNLPTSKFGVPVDPASQDEIARLSVDPVM